MAASRGYVSFKDLPGVRTQQTLQSVASDLQLYQGENEPDIERGRPASESDALIRHHQPTAGILKKVGLGLVHFGKSTAISALNGVAWILTYPLLFLIAVITAVPNAIYAFTSNPDKIKEILPKMGKLDLTLSIFKLISAFLINAIMNAFFLTTAWKSIKPIFKNLSDKVKDMKSGEPKKILVGLKEIIKVFTLFFLALAAAIAAGALAFVSLYSWMSGLAALFTVASIGVNLASRLVGVDGIFTRLGRLFSKEAQVQRKLSDTLNHIDLKNAAHKQKLLDGFEIIKTQMKEPGSRLNGKDANYLLDADDLEAIYIRVAELVSELNETEQNFLRDPTNQKVAMNYFLQALEVFYATSSIVFLALPYGMAFLQKGRDGINILLHLTNYLFGVNWGLDNATRGAQIGAGLPSGIATMMLAASFALKSPHITKRVFSHLYENPQDICKAIGLAAANYWGAYSPLRIGESEVDDKNNVFGFRPDVLGSTYEILVMLAGGNINACVTFDKGLLKNEFTIDELRFKDVVEKLEDTSTHCIKEETSTEIQRFARFR